MTDLIEPDALHHHLDRLDGWTGTTAEGITKRFTFADFAGSMRFVNRVADVAEQRDHHPDIEISWDTVGLRIISHAKGGVTQQCLELAAAIDAVAAG